MHASSKLKSGKDSSSYLVRESVSRRLCVYLICAFWMGFYSAEKSVVVVLTKHFDFFL